MALRVSSLVSLVGTILFAANSALAGIDEAYTKPADFKSWGDQLADFVGHKGFSKSYALVVGISKFESYANLPTANDPIRMRDYLLDEAGFDYVHVLTDEKATKARIDELMVDIVPGMVDPNDRFLFYWSGHGTQRQIGGRDVGYLPLADSRHDRFSTMVSMNDVRRWDALLETEQALFLLDACFSGLAGWASKSDLRGATIEQLSKPSHHIITAGTGTEKTIASDDWDGSIFTDAVLRAARGAADAGTEYEPDGVVSLSELLDYVRKRVADENRKVGWAGTITPQRRDLQTSDGEFFFLSTERKVAKLADEGADYQGWFKHGMPVVVMGATGASRTCDARADLLFWESIKNEVSPDYFEAYLRRVESSELCGLFGDIARLKVGLSSLAPEVSASLAPTKASGTALSELSSVERVDPQHQDRRNLASEPTQEAQVDILNRQINALRVQLAALEQALDLEQQRVVEQESTIADLGAKLNLALASKVEEVSRFRSEFFGRLRELLGDRPDVRIVGDRFVFQSEVLFPTASADIGPSGRDELSKLAQSLREIATEMPSDMSWVLQIDGHTDRRPIRTTEFPSNWELSTARAINVGKFLVSQGVPPERIAVAGFGEFQPLDDRDDEIAYRLNRRIEIKLTNP